MRSIQASRNISLRVSLGCDLAEVRPAGMEVRKFLQDQRATEKEVQACELALAEACNNAIQYAGEQAVCNTIQVEVTTTGDQIELRVRDNTPGFEWPDRIELPDSTKESGRGLFLIQSVMDEVSYFRGQNQNCLVMGLKRAQTHAERTEAQTETEQRLAESERVVRDMAEEMSFCYESLSAIFRCSADLGRTNDLEDFARRLLGDLARITSAEWFVLRLAKPGARQLSVYAASEAGAGLPPLALTEAGEHSAEVDAAVAREDIWFDHLSPLKASDPLGGIKPGSIGLVHPIFAGDALIGTLAIAKLPAGGGFTAVQANVIHTFTDFLAIQIVNSRYREEQVRNRLISRELEIAKTIQRSLLPKSIPRLPGYQLAGFCESAHQVGGDFYDVIQISDDAVLLIIADVMGKGIPAAMFAAILRSVLRAVPEWMDQPATLLARVNRLLFEELSGVDMFITAQLVYVDSRKRQITTASAGHCPLLLALDENGDVKSLSPEGMPLGILPDTTFSHHTEILPRNCRVLLYTDGLTEARNPGGEFFGQERLTKWLRKAARLRRTADELKEDLAAELIAFQSSATLNDDQTFLIMTE